MTSILFAVCSFLCAGLLILTRYFKNKQTTLQQQFNITLKKEKKAFEGKLRRSEHQIADIKKDIATYAKKVNTLEENNQNLNLQLKKNQQVSTETIAHLNAQNLQHDRDNEHFKAQTEALTLQLKAMTEENKSLRLKYANEKSMTQELKKITDKQQQTHHLLKKEQQTTLSLKKEIEQQKKRKHDLDVQDLIKTRKKLQHYQHFYSVVSGQKKMLEERILNWELALKLISTWILEHHKVSYKQPLSLGAQVALSLEQIKKGPLVHDEYTTLMNDSTNSRNTETKYDTN